MIQKWTYSLILMCTTAVFALSQISPGKLSLPHSHLEGISNCTQCHDLGNKVPDQKCLNCHIEIDQLIQSNRGFHVSQEVKTKECVDCHNDHHGEKFDMVRWDEEAFNHTLAGYPLEGQHAVIDCRACHQPDNIQDQKLKQRKDTYLGMGTACLDCHSDYHQNTLGNDCLQCHNFDQFDPAQKFNHTTANFQLNGAHAQVSCLECHPKSLKNGQEFQRFTDIPHAACTDCHSDAHQGNLEGACTQCHTEQSFSRFVGQSKFNHNTTSFELKGSHIKVGCFECHTSTANATTIFQDKLTIQETNCIECHADVHEGKFGTDCIQCHSEESFFALKEMNSFDHSITDFPLIGQHVLVDCKLCHTDRFTAPIDHHECKNCHQDYHHGEFKKDGQSPDCIACHTVNEKFTYTTFGPTEHQASFFPLEGAHLATPCFACHVDEEHWSFRNIGQSCVDCHDDIHENEINAIYYPNQDCTVCHTSESWRDISFDHSTTQWDLTGQHSNIECRTCHFESVENSTTIKQQFSNLESECISCHANIHGDQFAIEQITDCRRCHVTASWFPTNFNHNNTNFPLEGKHLEADCNACHTSSAQINGQSTIIYQIEKHECIDCHL
ncbi:MAG: hypothetical protein P1U56_09870 [Saprospiraceae bacterium]|nr:hypothetical protein [Saprospiraceae bacterium]